MDESSEISKTFYKIGKAEAPSRISGLDPKWRTFESLGQAMDYRVGLIAENDRFADLGSAKTFQELPVLDREQLRGCFDRFGYNPERTTIRRLGKDQFVFVSEVGSSTVVEIFKYYDFEKDIDSLNNKDRLRIESIMVSSGEGKTVVFTQPVGEQGFFVQYSSQDLALPHYILHRGTGIASVGSYPLGAIANPNSNQFAGLSLLHELRHVYQSQMPEYESELDASEYALQMDILLEKEGIDLTPRVSQEQARKYLEKYLLGYAKKHHPVRTLANRMLGKIQAKR